MVSKSIIAFALLAVVGFVQAAPLPGGEYLQISSVTLHEVLIPLASSLVRLQEGWSHK
jgi:hypothetical protein